jgi:predicted TIM-barrel fold metal-dependent hydrolase
MRESRSYGSVRGALSNERPYRELIWQELYSPPSERKECGLWTRPSRPVAMQTHLRIEELHEANTPKRPWHSVPNWPDHVTGDEMVAAMDKVGVDGAIFISAFSMYRYDASYAVEVQQAHPDRFAIVKPVDPDDPAVGDVIADWKQIPGTVGIRIMLTKEPGRDRDPTDPGLDRIARAAVKHDFPVNILCWGNVDAGTALIDRHPDTRFIIDHLAILQPRTHRPRRSHGPTCRRCWTLPSARTR